MVHKQFFTLTALGLVFTAGAADRPRFYPDDPVCCSPPPHPITNIEPRKTDPLYDFIYNSFARVVPTNTRAQDVNTVGDVIESSWFTYRHSKTRMSREALQHGPGENNPPQPPYEVVGAKLDGITPGFRVRDSRGHLYFVKPDPLDSPELSTAADVIGSRFFYALGYNTPQNYLFFLKPGEIKLGDKGEVMGENGKLRPMTRRDILKVVWRVPRNKDGSYRFLASLAVEGKPLGPFRYKGTRSDDPNDLIPHEDRRELRGLHVLCAWLNHTDAKGINSLDTLVQTENVKFVRHHLIDFGAILGSDSDAPKDARFGNEYIFPTAGEFAKDAASLGLNPKPWETPKTPKLRGVGRFQSKSFDPETWTPNYPNPAFLQRTPADEYWAAKQVTAFTDDDIRAVVETGRYSDPKTLDYITRTLIERRDKIGRTYFTKVLALDNFRVENDRLAFDDLAVSRGYAPPRQLSYAWSTFDNKANRAAPISGATSPAVPATASEYLQCKITNGARSVDVFLRREKGSLKIVGVER